MRSFKPILQPQFVPNLVFEHIIIVDNACVSLSIIKTTTSSAFGNNENSAQIVDAFLMLKMSQNPVLNLLYSSIILYSVKIGTFQQSGRLNGQKTPSDSNFPYWFLSSIAYQI